MATTVVQNYATSNNAYTEVFDFPNLQRIQFQYLTTGVYGNYTAWNDFTSYNPGDVV
jgi:hypothetical protein